MQVQIFWKKNDVLNSCPQLYYVRFPDQNGKRRHRDPVPFAKDRVEANDVLVGERLASADLNGRSVFKEANLPQYGVQRINGDFMWDVYYTLW